MALKTLTEPVSNIRFICKECADQKKKETHHFLNSLNIRDLFDFGSVDIDREKFFGLVKQLDMTLFMTVKKIVFVQTEEDYNRLFDELRYDFINFDKELGKHLLLESTAVINLHAIIKCCKEDPLLCRYFHEEVNIGLWTTLIHELRHVYQNNPLFKNDFNGWTKQQLEDDAEQYCRNEFENWLAFEDYFVLRSID